MAENGNSEFFEYDQHTDQYQTLLDIGLQEAVAENLDSLYAEGIVAHEELDQRALDALKELSDESAIAVINEMRSSDLQSVANKSAYLCSLMKVYHKKLAAGLTADPSVANKPGPNCEKMQEILQRTGYSHEVTMGQRKYGGPPPNWEGPQPGPGHEIFCGKLPPTVFEDTLIPMFEKCGTIWDLRLMMDPVTGNNKSFCFVTFTSKEATQRAVKELDGYEIRPGKKLKVNISIANVRLFVGNLPKNKTKDDLKAEFSKHVEGLSDVIVYINPDDPSKRNRGFAFLEFESHKSAADARRRLSSMPVFGVELIVNWAEPQEEPGEEVMSKVKILYVRNLKSDVTESQVKEKFEEYGMVERVKKFKDYCFVHFEERDDALKAMAELNKTLLNTSEMLITLAKPPTANKQQKKQQQQQQFGAGAWSQHMMPRMVRGNGRGRVLRHAVPVGAYSVASSQIPYGYEDYDYNYDYNYDYSEYDYEDEDYYGTGTYGYSAAPVPAYPVRPLVRGRGLPVRAFRAAALVPVARRAVRGIVPRRTVRGIMTAAGAVAATGRGIVRVPRGGRRVLTVRGGRSQGLKRKAVDEGSLEPEAKHMSSSIESWDSWETQPIVQQPLSSMEDEWYQDSWE